MNQTVPFFNWSLKRVLDTETGAFNLARIRILYVIMLFALFKVVIVLFTAIYYEQGFQLMRGLISLVVYLVLFKLLLSGKQHVPMLTHLIILTGAMVTWSIVFISAQKLNIVALQFVFMIILSSFYLLNRFWGFLYTIVAVVPIMLFLLITRNGGLELANGPDELAFPGQFMVTLLNFVTFTLAHYLYRDAFNSVIDEKASLNERLKTALVEAERLAKSKSDFLSTMSHELRTPLNMVIGMTELLRDSPHDDDQEENLRLLHFSAANLHSLINDILDFNKIDSGMLELERTNVNLQNLMQSICSGMELQGNEKGLKINLEVDELLKHQSVITDPTRLSQIIYNIVGNGVKFTSKGAVSLALRADKLPDGKIKVHFSVRDTGIGISIEKQQMIFEPFVQASTNTTRNYGGTGLGLSIVKKLLELFNSKIELESIPGEGSHFYFDIIFDEGKPEPVSKKRHVHEHGELEGFRLLVAEDNPLNAFLIRKLCAKWKVDPVMVANGREALAEVEKAEFDLLLMDLHMPEMDGYESAKAIRKIANGQRDKLAIIALTASVSHNLEMKILEAGIDDFIRKPFSPNDLYLRLKQVAIALEK
ncbi:MAG: ATP-binding protein [Bacteroidia bacterium]|jgi:signal transduction histidine kinase/ActR/RegA family two-component response regulator